MSKGDWAHELWVPRVTWEQTVCVVCNVLVQRVCGPGWDKEPAQAEMRLTILLIGFR